MSARRPTAEQQAAIDAAGEVLVSASAGSGKTFVMIEKIISLILSGRADVSSVLAVTFTKAAAAEMKERLRSAIFARIGQEQDEAVRARLKAQLSEIGTADICTLHSFCSNVIRRYLYEADIDGNFRVADDAEAEKLKTRAVSLTFDKLLTEKSEKFALLCRVFAGGRGFGKLADVLQKSYEKAIVRADFKGFLQELPSRYDGAHFARLAEEAFEPAARHARRLKEKCAALERECAPYIEAGTFGDKHAAYLAARQLFADDVLAAGNVFDAAALVRDVKLINKPPNTKLKNAGDAAALELDARLASLKDDVDAVKKSLSAFRTRGEEEGAFCASGEVAAALCELISEFSDTYAALKRRAGALDFSDLEHKCLELLNIPSVCEEVRGRYTHVFVDEYQDVNPAQERILSLVAGENVFMVGDAKQSIYGFRGCSAGFFAEKYARLAKEGRALTLNGNFRSCKNILDTVNTLFSAAMTEEVGSVDYAATSMMQAGSAAQAGGEVRFEFVPEKEETERAERDVYSVAARLGLQEDEEYAEGALIANIVLSEVGRSRPDPAAGGERKMGFGDIVVLTRGKTEKAGRIVGELVRRGIPVAASAEVNVCDYPEVKTMLAVLQYLDNGAQDIPLAAALKSDMGGVTDEELANIRLAAKQDDSFSAACAAYEKNGDALAEKLQAFRARAEHFRLLCTVKSAAEVMAVILAETGMELTLLSLPCGEERVRRLRRFMAEAGELSVPEFLDRLKNGGYKVGFSESGGENAVRVMTMHASKGLEFPVVIVAGLNGRFSAEDMRGILFDDEWGFAPPAYDLKNYTAGETILRAVVRARLRRKRAEDEMRLFYVALTRAKSCLHLVFEEERPFDAANLADASCFADFVDFEKFRDLYSPVFGGELTPPAPRVLSADDADGEAKAAVLAQYERPYPFESSLRLPVKTSASAVLQEREKQLAEQLLPEEERASERAAGEFYSGPADAETGTAYHAFLEQADFSAPPEREAARLYALLGGKDSPLDLGRMERILRMPVFARLQGFTLWREREFLLCAPACEVLETDAQDELLVQGVIDLMAVRGNECIIVDYKYSSHGEEQLVQTYTPQLKIYAAAAKRLPGVEKVTAYIVNILREFEIEVFTNFVSSC